MFRTEGRKKERRKERERERERARGASKPVELDPGSGWFRGRESGWYLTPVEQNICSIMNE